MQEPLFTIENLDFSSRTADLIKDISFTIERGSVTVLAGKSGKGKSTLLKLIAGILVPTGGRVLYDGIDIQFMNQEQNELFRRKASYVFQDSALWANQDIMHNVSLPLQIHFPSMPRKECEERVMNLCRKIGYDRGFNLRPADLSMGEQKKISIARALIIQPEILFLDECTESLDKRSAEIVIQMVKEFIASGNTVVYVSHSRHFRHSIGGNMLFVDDGRLFNRNEYEEKYGDLTNEI
ncbi:MAG: ATP-binding cassette domain-containing protein [Treponema sp.]|nr:ATP-binding cassette domain-containing protein [Treponema sp.]